MSDGLLRKLGDRNSKDKRFLLELHRRCVEEYSTSFTPNISGPTRIKTATKYTPTKLSPEELSQVLRIVTRYDDLFFMPIQGSFGFHPAFAVCQYSPIDFVKLRESARQMQNGKFAEGKFYQNPPEPGEGGEQTQERGFVVYQFNKDKKKIKISSLSITMFPENF